MSASDSLRTVEIGDRAGDLEHTMIGAGRQRHLLGRLRQHRAGAGVRTAQTLDL